MQRVLRSRGVKIALDSGVPIAMVGLDVTMQVLVEALLYRIGDGDVDFT